MKLIILNGPPGVGKTTIAARLHQELPASALIDIDELRRTIPNYREQRAENLRQAYQLAADALQEHLRDGKDVIIDKAISDSDTLDTLINMAVACGADICEILLFADKATVQKRADDRGYRPGSLLTPEKVAELWENADTLRKERFNMAVIDTTHLNIDQVSDTVGSYVDPHY